MKCNNETLLRKRRYQNRGVWIIVYYIVINSKFPPTERAKTILHEVAHFLLHHANYLRPVFLDHKSFIAGLEKEADYFAYLLMQEWLEEEESL